MRHRIKRGDQSEGFNRSVDFATYSCNDRDKINLCFQSLSRESAGSNCGCALLISHLEIEVTWRLCTSFLYRDKQYWARWNFAGFSIDGRSACLNYAVLVFFARCITVISGQRRLRCISMHRVTVAEVGRLSFQYLHSNIRTHTFSITSCVTLYYAYIYVVSYLHLTFDFWFELIDFFSAIISKRMFFSARAAGDLIPLGQTLFSRH